MQYVYGPMLSRRLGQSLGVDLIPLKTCNWNCVYCQLGRTVPLSNERKDFFPPEDILKEVKTAFKTYKSFQIDWIAIVGSGEPLLCKSIGWLIQQFRMMTKIPIAVITGGSLFYRPEARHDVALADAVLPTLNAGSPELYKRISRPHPEITFEKYVEGLVKLGEEYRGHLWPEVMLIKGLNDTEDALQDIACVLQRIRCDEIHINLPVRPPAESWVQPSDEEGLIRAMVILGDKAHVIRPVNENTVRHNYETWTDTVTSIVSRHPLREEEVTNMLSHFTSRKSDTILDEIKSSGNVQIIERYGRRFWCAADARYSPRANIHQGVY